MRFQKHGKAREQSVSSLNLVSQFGLVTPGYKQDLSKRRVIEFVYLPQDEVLLLASMDGQYPYWVSRTGIRDVETNTAIANAVLFDSFSSFTSQYPSLNKLTEHRYRRRFYVSGNDIKTPFDYGFSSDPNQIEYWGHWMARGISSHHHLLRQLCACRELEGRYLEFLKSYLATLETQTDDAVRDYEGNRALIRLVTEEDYLFVSEHEEIRDAYVAIRRAIGDLYNRYMTIVR